MAELRAAQASQALQILPAEYSLEPDTPTTEEKKDERPLSPYLRKLIGRS